MNGCLGIMNNIFESLVEMAHLPELGNMSQMKQRIPSQPPPPFVVVVVDGIMSTQYVDSRYKVCRPGALIGS